MNLEIRKKEIAERLNEIRALAEKEDNLSVLEKLEKETDALQEERNLIDKKLSMKRKFDSAAMFQIRSDAEAIENMEKRGKDLKEGRTVTVTSSNVLLPSHTNAEIGAYPFRDVSTLVDKVRIVNLEGGETYKKSFVKSTGMAGLTAEGDPYTTAEPTFGYATITKVKVTAYAEITEELEKLPALPYSQEVLRGINIALRKKISQQILRGAGSTNTFKGIFANNVEALADNTDIEISTIDDTTLDEIIYAYGGDEEVEGGAALILSKNDLRAFANLRTTEGRKVHIVDYSASTIDGIPYVINSNCGSVVDPNTEAGTYCMAYGALTNYEVPVFSPVEIAKSTDYKFKDGIISYKASVFTGGNVVGYKGFLRIKKKAATVGG
ncbi:MAG: phage major capsid protein [Bacillota bacterium]|jgi:HK97 family phage major capsid protein|nr:phage major capsid protein [Bacillota bacterium]TAH59207.1 MAG: phage major capsid protein [Bacillota bacterium]